MITTRKFAGKQYIASGKIRSKSDMKLNVVSRRFNYRITKERNGYQLWVRGKDLPRTGEGYKTGQQRLKRYRKK